MYNECNGIPYGDVASHGLIEAGVLLAPLVLNVVSGAAAAQVKQGIKSPEDESRKHNVKGISRLKCVIL